ncbi:hypothetical protein ACFLRP_02685 [Bacteroidota bacterium]
MAPVVDPPKVTAFGRGSPAGFGAGDGAGFGVVIGDGAGFGVVVGDGAGAGAGAGAGWAQPTKAELVIKISAKIIYIEIIPFLIMKTLPFLYVL